jgi:Cytidylate kinase-like family
VTRLITIAREYLSGASSISRMLADRLGWRVLDHDVMSEIFSAAQSGSTASAGWHSDLWFRKLVQEVVWNGGIQRLADGDDFSVRAEVIAEAARMADCIIIGRGAQCLLRDRKESFHVFLHAPLPVKLERGARHVGNDVDIESLIREHDDAQAAFVREHFDLDWRDPRLYDVMLDTRHGYRTATEAIFAAAGFRTASAGL